MKGTNGMTEVGSVGLSANVAVNAEKGDKE